MGSGGFLVIWGEERDKAGVGVWKYEGCVYIMPISGEDVVKY